MKRDLYETLYGAIKDRDTLLALARKHPGVSHGTLLSIYSQKYQKATRMTAWVHKQPGAAATYYRRYLEGIVSTGEPTVLLQLAEDINLAPCLLARNVLESHIRATDPESGNDNRIKGLVSRMIKQPDLVTDPRLRDELQQCIRFDDNYSPLVDVVRCTIGLEYEYILQEKLNCISVPYKGEEELRRQNYPKTPDVMLEIPLGIDNHVVRWIESKASFGDDYNHRINLDQFFSYVNRYGPGLVIYWFGFIDDLDDCRDRGIILMDHFPRNPRVLTA